MSNIVYEVYRNEGAALGTTKDWVIGISPNHGELIIKYGKTGHKLKTSVIKTSSPTNEMSERIRKKVVKGYYYVGQSGSTTPEAQIINSDQISSSFCWSITGLLSKELLRDRVRYLAQDLHKVNIPETWTYESERFVVSEKAVIELNTCIAVSGSTSNWSIGGKIERFDPLPSLFLMAVAKDFGDISFFDDENQEFTAEFLGNEHYYANPNYSLDLLNDMAIALALKRSPVNLFRPSNQETSSFLQLRL